MEHRHLDPGLLGGENATTVRALAFERLQDDHPLVAVWHRLATRHANPTQSHDFVAALADTLLAEAQIEVFAARGQGGVGALLPLCHGPGPLARWRQTGAREVFEPSDALYENEDAAHGLARQLARESRPITLDRLPAGSPLVPALRRAMRGRGLVSVRPGTACPTLALGPQWHDPETQFNAGRRSDFRRAQRRAAEFGHLDSEIITPDPARFDALFDEAIAVELASWKREAGTAIASCPRKEAFFRDFLRRAALRGTLRMAFLRVDRRAIAMQLAIESGGAWWLFKIGFDESFARCSPGTLLMLHTIGHAARSGLARYELLGEVEPWIAQFWTREEHQTLRVRTYPFGLRGAAALVQDGAFWLGERLRRSARPSRA